jgi:hypothetical protein
MVEVVITLDFEVIWNCGPFFEKYKTWGDSYGRSTEQKSSPVLKPPRTLQSQLNNGFCRQRWANYRLAVLVQPTYVHTCGTSTVNLANLVFLGASNAEILAFDCAHKEIIWLGQITCQMSPNPKTNQKPTTVPPHISVNNGRMGTFQVAVLCSCAVIRHMCHMNKIFIHLWGGGALWSIGNHGRIVFVAIYRTFT